MMVQVPPGLTPRAIPVETVTVATAVLEDDHTPNASPLEVSVVPAVAHTVVVPLMVPALGAAFTVTDCVASVPQPVL